MQKGTLCAPSATGQSPKVAITNGIFGQERGKVNPLQLHDLILKIVREFPEEIEKGVGVLRIETILVGAAVIVLRQLRSEEVIFPDRYLLMTGCFLEV